MEGYKKYWAPSYLLAAILILAAVLRFWGLGTQEFYHDEGLYAFRSIGYLDYLQNDDQTTPVQWFAGSASLPFWTGLSFHDAPPLFFILQNFIFRVFGDSLFAARLPSALAGIGAVYLVYLIFNLNFKTSDAPNIKNLNPRTSDAQKLQSKFGGLFAAFLLSISLIHIWISRSSLLESTQIFLILLSLYFFLRFLDDPSRWFLFGTVLGLNFLTKYTSVFLVFVYGAYLLFFRKELYKRKELYFALAVAAILFLPVIVYNFYLYKTTGHFDLQLSYLFRQPTPEWRLSLGKIQDPFSEIFSNLQLMYSFPFLAVFSASIGWAIYEIFSSRTSDVPNIKNRNFRTSDVQKLRTNYLVFWLLNFIFITLVLSVIGSAFRFIALYAPIAVIIIAALFKDLFFKFNKKLIFKTICALFLIYELIFAMDIFIAYPDFGIVKLDGYFDSEFGGLRSSAIPISSNPHLNKIIKGNLFRIPESGRLILIIYDGNIGLSPRLWLFTRRNFYHGIPAFSIDQFKNLIRTDGLKKFKGYDIYFVKASGKTYLNPFLSNPTALEFEQFLQGELGLSPIKMIYGYNNLLMFTVYKFSL